MRNAPDDAADQSGGRRRGHRGAPSGSHRMGSAGGQREAPAGGESSVFSPGYDGRREPVPDRQSGGHGRPAPWQGTAAAGAGGKGPVRGFPPLPGQPLPMYPPGQFSAWNRGRSRSGGSAPGPGGQPGPTGEPAQTGSPVSADWQGDRQPDSGRPSSGYYGQDTGGYSLLAVSDPAADVTSTQTWHAVAEGRATGTWTSPFKSGDGQTPGDHAPDAADPDVRAARSSGFKTGTGPRLAASAAAADQLLGEPQSGHRGPVGPPVQDPTEPASGRRQRPYAPPQEAEPGSGPERGRDRRLAPWSPQAAAARAAAGPPQASTVRGDTVRADPVPADTGRASRGTSTARGRAGTETAPTPSPVPRRTRQVPADQTDALVPGRAAPDIGSPGTPGRVGSRRAARSQGPQRKRGGHQYPRSAILIAVVLVVAAGGALYLGAHFISSRSHQTASPRATPTISATPTPTPTPTLGPYGHIASRLDDPVPLTVAQLYPARFNAGGAVYTRTAVRLSKSCGSAVAGSSLQSAIGSAGCTQAVRASYLSGTKMGTIGVFNLKNASAASKAGRAAGASNFVAQLPAKTGPTKKLGHGSGVEEAVFKGHYLILIWAEFTNLRTPKTKPQQASLATFMTQLLQNTANVSLSNRMVNGTP